MRKWNIGWGPVSKCNMNCAFCYSKFKRKCSKDLELKDWKKFIDENYDKINSINYGTGENTLSDDWFKLIRYIKENYPQITQALTTNGYLSEAVKNEYNLKSFVECVDEVDVSLDFAERDKHNALRGQQNAYDWAINTLNLCKKYSKRTTIVFIGSSKNLYKKNIDGLFNIAEKYNAVLRMNIFRPTEVIDDKTKEFIADYNTIVEILKYISDKYAIISLGDTLFSTILAGETRMDPSGELSIRILANGNITPSTYLIKDNFCVGNITQTNILAEIEGKLLLNEIIHKTLPNECEGCVYASKCNGGVYDRRYLWFGSLNKKDPYCPHIFKKEVTPCLKIVKSNFKSVHDDYLPTIFFMPKNYNL